MILGGREGLGPKMKRTGGRKIKKEGNKFEKSNNDSNNNDNNNKTIIIAPGAEYSVLDSNQIMRMIVCHDQVPGTWSRKFTVERRSNTPLERIRITSAETRRVSALTLVVWTVTAGVSDEPPVSS